MAILARDLDYFQERLSWQHFSKNRKNPIFGPFWALFAQIWADINFPEKKKGIVSFFNIRIIYHCAKKTKQPNETFLRKLLDRQTKNLFIPLISLWDTVNFRVLGLIEKSLNLIGQEHFRPYLTNQNFPKYEICSSIWQLQ